MPLEDLVTTAVRRRLLALKAALRAHLVGKGLALVLIALVAGVFFSFAVDRKLDMERSQRAVILAAALAGVGYVLWRFLLRPLGVPMDPEELALVFEHHYPQLDDRLISTLQFSFADVERLGSSEGLVREVAKQANAMAGGLDSTAPLEGRETWKRLGIAAAAVAILVTFSILRAEDMGPWFQRNILFRDIDYPRETYLEVEVEPGLEVVRGGSITVTVTADLRYVVPDEVIFHKKFPGLGTEREAVRAGQAQPNVFVKKFENITERFEFRVTGNDHTTEWYEVNVVDPPELVSLRFTISYPGYMDRPKAAVSAQHGVLSIPPGSRLTMAGRANKDLAASVLLLDSQPVPPELGRLEVEDITDADGKVKRRGVKGFLQLADRVKAPSLTLQIKLEDTRGIINPRGAMYVVRIEPDGAPSVHVDRKGIRGDISTRAMLPLVIQVRDDHAVSGIEVMVETTPPPAEPAEPSEAGPAGAEPRPTSRPATTRPVKRTFVVPDVPTGQRHVSVPHTVDLEPLKLVVGQFVRVQAAATDSLPKSFGGPNRATSALHTFKVVSDEELLRELLRRQKEIRDAFRRAVDMQAAVRDRVRAVSDQLVGGGGIDPEVRRRLNLAAKDQRSIAMQCSVTAQQMQEVLDEIVANRIGTPTQERNLAGKIIRPLEDISKKPMSDVAASLVRASKQTDVGALGEFSARRAEILDGFHSRLVSIYKQMEKERSRQELVNWLKRILGDSEEVERIIQKHLDEQSGEIWDDKPPKR